MLQEGGESGLKESGGGFVERIQGSAEYEGGEAEGGVRPVQLDGGAGGS